jgi:hypothetical protein
VDSVRLVDPRYTLLGLERPQVLRDGGWARMRVIVGEATSLLLVVRDAQGRPVEGVDAHVELDASEQSMLSGPGGPRWLEVAERRFGRTAADGTLQLMSLWSRKRLRLRIVTGSVSYEAAYVLDDELLLQREDEVVASGGRPLVLQPGERRSLVARVASPLMVEGQVRWPDGTPVVKANVGAAQTSVGAADAYPSVLLRTETGPDGRYAARLHLKWPDRPLWFVAKEKRSKQVRSNWTGFFEPTDGGATARTVDPRSATTGRLQVDLVVAPTFPISGRVLGPDGKPSRRSRVWATPPGAAHHQVQCAMPQLAVDAREDGSFAIFGLSEGPHDLHVSEETGSFYSYAGALHRFPNVLAGTRGLELRLPERRSVQITLRTHGGKPKHLTVLHGKRYPVDPARHARVSAPKRIEVDGLSAWPEGASVGFGGIGGSRDASGPMSIGYYGGKTDEAGAHRMTPVEPGWYVIGVRGSDESGADFHPVATKELYFEAGDYTIDFELRPTAHVVGRIASATPECVLAVAVHSESGARLALPPTPGHCRLADMVETDASGRFVLRGVPVGPLRLRVGTPDELRQGRSRYEVPIMLAAGLNPPLDLR